MSKTDDAEPGDIVEPGTRVGLVGLPDDPHLHLEVRELENNYLMWLTDEVKSRTVSVIQNWGSDQIRKLVGATKNYINAAILFDTRPETYGWRSGCRLGDIDTDGDGYPNDITIHNGTKPFLGPYWIMSYERGKTGKFWEHAG